MDYTKFDQTSYSSTSTYNVGLREYMVSVYRYMALALLLTGLVAFTVSLSPSLMSAIFGSPLGWVVALAPLGVVFYMSYSFNSLSVQGAQIAFWVYAGLIGLSLSAVFLAYTGESIARVFFITASVFGTMSIYGYATKKDLTNFGSFLMMGLMGIIITSLVNIFIGSSAIQFVTSLLGLFIFIGFTAYDTQNIKNTYYNMGGASQDVVSKIAIFGALRLYMDFVNIFLYLLQFIGNRRD